MKALQFRQLRKGKSQNQINGKEMWIQTHACLMPKSISQSLKFIAFWNLSYSMIVVLKEVTVE